MKYSILKILVIYSLVLGYLKLLYSGGNYDLVGVEVEPCSVTIVKPQYE